MKSPKHFISILKEVKNRPTIFGLYLVLAIIALFVQAYMHNYNIVYIMMFMLVGLAIVSSIYGFFNLFFLKVDFVSCERFFANTKSTFKIALSSSKKQSLYDINIIYKDTSQNIQSIAPAQRLICTLEDRVPTRGETSLSLVEVSSTFPLGYERKYKRKKLEHSFVVYAEPKGESLLGSTYKSSAKYGQREEFDGIRNYIFGENISLIHWASLAKDESLKSKHFLYENETKTLHFSFNKLKGEREKRLSQLTLWVLECERYKLEFTLEIKQRVMSSKKECIDEILEAIAKY